MLQLLLTNNLAVKQALTAPKTTEKRKKKTKQKEAFLSSISLFFFLCQLVQIHLLSLQQGTNKSMGKTAFIVLVCLSICVKKENEIVPIQLLFMSQLR